MSILADVLSSAGQVEIVDLSTKIREITEQISVLKSDVISFTEDRYIKFLPYFEEDEALFQKANSLSTDFNDLQVKIENQVKRELADSTGELQKLKESLKESECSIFLANKLFFLHNCISEATKEQESGCYFAAAEKLKQFECSLVDIENELCNLDIYNALLNEFTQVQADFSITVLEQWEPCIKWRKAPTDINNANNQISLTIQRENLTSDLLKALNFYNLLLIEVTKFSEKFLENVLIPTIDKSSTVFIENNEKDSTLLINFEHSKRASCVSTINNLTKIFTFFFRHFDLAVDDSKSLIVEIRERIAERFCKHFIFNCLNKAIPKRQEELNSYQIVIKELAHFDQLLHNAEFLPPDNKQLLEYTDNVDALITNKICDSYLEDARRIMKRDLHDMVEAGVHYKTLDDVGQHPLGFSRKLKSVQDSNSDRSVLVSELSSNTFQFPLCQISKSCHDLLELARTLLNETLKSKSVKCALKLFFTVRNVFKLYCDIVPLHHKKMLDTIPQQAVLLRNNCYYLAHELMCLSALFKAQQPETLKAMVITFVDIINSLRTIGDTTLGGQINIQKKLILDILRDSGLVTLIENPEFPQGIEKAIRQCNRQLMLLQKVWQPVLPTDTYCKSVGVLCNGFVQELIDRVCSTSDIPANTAAELVRVFSIVQTKTPSVFPEPKEVYQYVDRWSKFNELVRLLGASLRDVEERWSDGKGPLAQEFSANQVKQLVKALFQTSERRAALLSRIK